MRSIRGRRGRGKTRRRRKRSEGEGGREEEKITSPKCYLSCCWASEIICLRIDLSKTYIDIFPTTFLKLMQNYTKIQDKEKILKGVIREKNLYLQRNKMKVSYDRFLEIKQAKSGIKYLMCS